MASISPVMLMLLLVPSIATSTRNHTLPFTVELIHRDSPRSPFYNASLSPVDRNTAAILRSISRYHHVGINLDVTFSAHTTYDNFEYLMSFSIGTPPFNVIAMIDTGSDITWVQCEPCIDCYKQKPPKFNPAGSSTYLNLHCDDHPCTLLKNGSCSGDNCQFTIEYVDKSMITGLLATDIFTFMRSSTSISSIVFGCTHQSKGIYGEDGGGLVGLGGGPLSFISQLGSTVNGLFTYCLVPVNSVGLSSTMSFGMKVEGPGMVTTSIVPGRSSTLFFLSLLSVSFRNVGVAVPGPENGNIVIDSGTRLTYLPSEVLKLIEFYLSDMIKLPRAVDRTGMFRFCFKVDGSTPADAFPYISFMFTGAEVRLPPSNTFELLSSGLKCLAMLETGPDGISVLGNYAQQNFLVQYDLANKEVSFMAKDCTQLG